MSSCSSPAPLTAAEQELQRIKVTEVNDTNVTYNTNMTVYLICYVHYVYSSCMFLLISCRIKLYGYVDFLPNTSNCVYIRKREKDRCKNCFFCPQDERRRIGTPTARARVCCNLVTDHFLSCVGTHVMFLFCRLQWSLAWTKGPRLFKVLHSRCKRRPNELCSNSRTDVSTTYSWWAQTEKTLLWMTQRATCNIFPVNKNKPCVGVCQYNWLCMTWPWTKLVCVCCVAETGCRERDHWAGSHQSYRDPWTSLQDSHRFPQIPLLHLQTFPPGSAAGGAGSVHSLIVVLSFCFFYFQETGGSSTWIKNKLW